MAALSRLRCSERPPCLHSIYHRGFRFLLRRLSPTRFLFSFSPRCLSAHLSSIPALDMEMEVQIRKATFEPLSSPSSSPLGRIVCSVLGSRPKHLQAAIARADCPSERSSEVSLDESLRYIRNYATDAVEKGEPLDQILIPMIEHSLKSNRSKHSKQVFVLLNWLFEDELLLRAISTNLTKIIHKKEDNYISLGWCILVRGLIEKELPAADIANIGNQKKRKIFLKFLSQSIPRLATIMSKGSVIQDGYELPKRVSVAASDCILVLTIALAQTNAMQHTLSNKIELSDLSRMDRSVTFMQGSTAGGGNKTSVDQVCQSLEENEAELLLWRPLDELVILVQKLLIWSKKGRPLYAKGLGFVLKWLKEIKEHYCLSKEEAGGEMLKSGWLLLSSCWKHYGVLLQLEGAKFSKSYGELLEQYISAIQFCSEDAQSEHVVKKNSAMETQNFFLTCLCLLWGRLDSKQLEIAVAEYGQQMTHLLLSQLQSSDVDVAEAALTILRAIIFETSYSYSDSKYDANKMAEVLPLLLSLLDERDSTSRAVVLLVAEYCLLNPNGQIVQEILRRLEAGNPCQRQNAVDTISEVIQISSTSGKMLPHLKLEDIAKCLLGCLGDEDLMIHTRVLNLLPQIDPAFVLPALVWRMRSLDEKMKSCATEAVLAVLKYHNHSSTVIVMLLDCISGCAQTADPRNSTLQSVHANAMASDSDSKSATDQIFSVIPEWAESVRDWNLLIEPLLDKMFAEPSNPVLVRFLSQINEYLAEAKEVVLQRILFSMQEQEAMDRRLFSDGAVTSDGFTKLDIFHRLCPLLILRLLPLRVFSDLNSSLMYGQLLNQNTLHDENDSNMNNDDSVALLLLKRAANSLEFEEVRKLAAELCGRVHPHVLLPIINRLLDSAVQSKDIFKLKTYLFTICTSLVVRGNDSSSHPALANITKIVEKILLWPSLDSSEVSKVQHGCIDYLALVICAQMQTAVSSGEPVKGLALKSSVLHYVVQRLTSDQSRTQATLRDMDNKLGRMDESLSGALVPLSFRICMANVLISICQKISSSCRSSFARATLPVLIKSIGMISESEVRAAYFQVLFSAVYNLKTAVLPYSTEMFNLALKALRKGSDKEKIAGVKLMASLMSSEDAIVQSISADLLEARSMLANIPSQDPSPELRQLCEKLLMCLTCPI